MGLRITTRIQKIGLFFREQSITPDVPARAQIRTCGLIWLGGGGGCIELSVNSRLLRDILEVRYCRICRGYMRHIYMYVYMHAYIQYIHILYIHIRIHVCMHVCTYVYVYVYIYIHIVWHFFLVRLCLFEEHDMSVFMVRVRNKHQEWLTSERRVAKLDDDPSSTVVVAIQVLTSSLLGFCFLKLHGCFFFFPSHMFFLWYLFLLL